MVREARERECNARAEAVGGINEDMDDLGKNMERNRDEAGTEGAALAPSEDNAHSIAYEVRERSEGGEDDQRASVNRAKDAVGRERA